MASLGKRVADFKSRFSQLLGPKRQGYDELERPLVGAEDDFDRDSVHSAGGPTSAAYRPPGAGPEEPAAIGGLAGTTAQIVLPSQAEEMQEISALAKDASEILWEMVVMGETGEDMLEIRGRAEMLQAQLRGLINDYAGGDEKLLAGAFEAFEMLSRCLEDQKAPAPTEIVPAEPAAPESVAPAPRAAPIVAPPPVATAPAAAPVADLINFD